MTASTFEAIQAKKSDTIGELRLIIFPSDGRETRTWNTSQNRNLGQILGRAPPRRPWTCDFFSKGGDSSEFDFENRVSVCWSGFVVCHGIRPRMAAVGPGSATLGFDSRIGPASDAKTGQSDIRSVCGAGAGRKLWRVAGSLSGAPDQRPGRVHGVHLRQVRRLQPARLLYTVPLRQRQLV